MIVHIIREACCSQDDQLGPLEIQLEFEEKGLKAFIRIFRKYWTTCNSKET